MANTIELKIDLNLAQATKSLQQLSESIQNAGSSVKALSDVKIPAMTGVLDASGKMESLGTAAENTAADIGEVSASAKTAAADVQDLGKKTETAGAKVQDLGEKTEKSGSRFEKLGMRMVGINQGIEVLSQLGRLVSAPIGKSASFEQYIVQFEVLLGSADKAKQRIKELSDFANTTPFELPEVVKASKLLQTFGGDSLATGQTLTMVGDMASAAGVGFDELATWVGRAYTNIKAGSPFGEAAMRLQELALMSGETRNMLEAMQKAGSSADAVWSEFTKSMSGYNGMMSKQAGTLNGLQSTLSDAVSSFERGVVAPLLPAMKSIIDGVTSLIGALEGMPSSLKAVAAGAMLVVPAFILLNSSFGATPYLLIGVVTAVTSLVSAIQSGEPVMAALITILGVVGTTLVALKLGLIGTAVAGQVAAASITTTLIPSLIALKAAFMSFMASPAGVVVAVLTALAAIGTAMYSHYQKSKQLKDQEAEHIKKKQQEILDNAVDSYSKMSKAQRAAKIAELKEQLDANIERQVEMEPTLRKARIGDASGYGVGPGKAVKDLTEQDVAPESRGLLKDYRQWLGFYEQKKALYEKLISLDRSAASSANALTEQQKKDAEELAQFRIGAMKDGYEKELAELNNKYEKEKTEHAEGSALRIAAYDWYTAKKGELDAKYAEDAAKSAADHQKRLAEIEADGVKARIDNAEKIAMASATTEAERLEITKRFALERIKTEVETQLKLLDIEQERANKIKDPERRTTELSEIAIQRKSVTSKATNATETVNNTYTTGVENLRKTLSVETGNADIKAEQDKMQEVLKNTKLTEDERQRIIEESERRIADIKDEAQKKNLEAQKDALTESLLALKNEGKERSTAAEELRKLISEKEVQIGDINIEQSKRAANAHKESYDERIDHLRKESKFADITATAIGEGFSQMWKDNLINHRQAANKEDAIWLAMENTAIGAIGNILQKQIESWIAEGAAYLLLKSTKAGAEVVETTAVATGEATKSAAVVAGESTKTAAKVSATATAAGAEISAISSLIAEMSTLAAVSSPAALAVNIASFGSAGASAALSTAAASAAQISAMAAVRAASIIGFSTGGPVTGPGGPTDDKIPAMLSNGEYVIQASQAKIFRPILEAINDPASSSKIKLPAFASGGIVGFDMPELARGFDFRIPNFTIPTMKIPQVSDTVSKYPDGSKDIVKELSALRKDIKTLKLTSKVDARGITSMVEQQQRLNEARRY